jgi:hypothetical protein
MWLSGKREQRARQNSVVVAAEEIVEGQPANSEPSRAAST